MRKGNAMGFYPVWRYQAETLAYRNAILATAGTISERSLQHVDKFVRDCKEAGVWASLIEVAPLAGNELNAAQVKVKYATLPYMTMVNFVAGDYSEATGLLGNGSTKYIDTAFNATGIPAAGHLSVYVREDATGTAQYFIGCTAAGEFAGITSTTGTDSIGSLGGTASAGGGTNPVAGFYYVERTSSTSLTLYRGNVAVGTPSATATTPNYPNQNVYAMARNAGGSPVSHANKRISFFSIGASLTATDRTNFHNIVQTLQTNLGRNV